jgi:hypothetical protein
MFVLRLASPVETPLKMSSFIVSSVMARTRCDLLASELLPERLLFSLDFNDLLKLIDALGEPLVFTTQPLELAALSRIWLGAALAIESGFPARHRVVDARPTCGSCRYPRAGSTAPRASGVAAASYSSRIRSLSTTLKRRSDGRADKGW